MSVEKGDFVLVDYTGRIKETGEVFDTTIEELAKNENLYKADELYEPRVVVIGEGWILKGLEDGIMNLEVDKTELVELPPEKGFGQRDPDKVKLMSIRRLTSRGITPQVGMRVEVDRKLAVVRTIGSGRVQLDFNPPLAGKTLMYEVTVQKKIIKMKEKMLALVHRRIPIIDINKFGLKKVKNQVELTIPEEAFYIEGLQLAKRGIATDIHKYFPDITALKIIEVIKRRESGGDKP